MSDKDNKLSRLLFIIPFLQILDRGIEKSGLSLAESLSYYFDKVSILCWDNLGDNRTKVQNKINIISLQLPRYFRSYFASFAYFYILLKIKPDVVVIFFAGHGEAWPIWLAKKFISFHLTFVAGYPIETTHHRFLEFRKLGFDLLVDSVVVKSHSMKKGIQTFFNKPVQVISNGVDTNYFRRKNVEDIQTIKDDLGILSNSVVLLTVASFEKRKGMIYIIESLERLKRRGITNIYYIIVGDGYERQYYEELINTSSVKVQIKLVGSVKDVRPYYSISDLFLLLSYGEGFPNVLLEAWSMELPVVVSTFSPFLEITNSRNAFSLSVDDKTGLDDLIEHVKHNGERFRVIGIENRKKVMEDFSWESVASRYYNNFRLKKLFTGK